MRNIWKRSSRPEAEAYQFPDAKELVLEEMTFDKPEPPAPPPPEEGPEERAWEPERTEEAPSDGATLRYAQVQADQTLLSAKRQAEEVLEAARREAREQAEAVYEDARKAGWEAGHAEGVSQGVAQALEENRKARAEQIEALSRDVAQFLEQASGVLDQQMDDNVGELRDLAITVAEKVVAVSLKSSSEVIGRMIQAAIDKRKRREWVRIHIAECDAKHMVKLSPALATALSSLSSQVRIIPMADEEPGTCVIEMPDEIIDASAATQLNSIRAMLADIPADEPQTFTAPGGRSTGYVPANDSSGLQRFDLQPDGKN